MMINGYQTKEQLPEKNKKHNKKTDLDVKIKNLLKLVHKFEHNVAAMKKNINGLIDVIDPDIWGKGG